MSEMSDLCYLRKPRLIASVRPSAMLFKVILDHGIETHEQLIFT